MRERERKRERKRGGKKERERERGRKGEREGERERERGRVPIHCGHTMCDVCNTKRWCICHKISFLQFFLNIAMSQPSYVLK